MEQNRDQYKRDDSTAQMTVSDRRQYRTEEITRQRTVQDSPEHWYTGEIMFGQY